MDRHALSGAYVCEAAPRIATTMAVILGDTLKNLDQQMPPSRSRRSWRSTAATEFLAAAPQLAVAIIEPLYRMDLRETARRVTVPVRAINADFSPTNLDANRRYFRDYASETVARSGHYPMLERPEAFNAALDRALAQLPSR